MVFLFILDVVTSLTLRVVVNCGFWIVCKSANGMHYIYKKIMPPGGDECPPQCLKPLLVKDGCGALRSTIGSPLNGWGRIFVRHKYARNKIFCNMVVKKCDVCNISDNSASRSTFNASVLNIGNVIRNGNKEFVI